MLPQVIAVDKEKCVNCHNCISVCPVKYCNDGSGDTIDLNPDMCIGCGECIDACSHGARQPMDDISSFKDVLRRRVPAVAVIAPAVATVFPQEYLRLNGWLKSFGIPAFDVSFGAELTVKSYLDHIGRNNPKMVIAQPCPALVTYIELYRPELLSYLAPAHSPMMHTVVMIREFYPQYRNKPIMVLSPCIAKKREFQETDSSLLNVTFSSLKKYLSETGIRLRDFEETEYENPAPERAVLFSSPGGLLRTARRWNESIEHSARKIEGPHQIYKYLNSLQQQITSGNAPLLLDCLSCELGCNGGTGTGNREMSADELEKYVEKRSDEMRARYQQKGIFAEKRSAGSVEKKVNEYWKSGLYGRTYQNRSSLTATLREPSRTDIEKLFKELEKKSDQDILNCSSCGYGSCEGMAKALFNGLNRKENCHHYQKLMLQRMMEEAQGRAMKDSEIANVSTATSTISGHISNLAAAINQMSSSISEIVQSTREANRIVEDGVHKSSAVNELMKELDESSREISTITQMISKITSQTHLLSLNATIEAVNAGEAGRGFVVVAAEVKNLSDETSRASREIQEKVGKILERTCVASRVMDEVSRTIMKVNDTVSTIAAAVTQQSSATEEIANNISGISHDIKLISENMGRLVVKE